MRNLISILCGLMLVTVAFAGTGTPDYRFTDVDPNLGPVAPSMAIDAQWDLLAAWDLNAVHTGLLYLGCEYAAGTWIVSDGGVSSAVATDNEIVRINDDGSFNSFWMQPTSSGWGWRDLAYDGTYIYGSGNNTIHAYTPDGTAAPAFNIAGPLNPNRALAYDPNDDAFWTLNWGPAIYEVGRDGTILYQGTTTAGSVYGAAYDAFAPDGPWLWLYGQSGTPGCLITKYDPINHVTMPESYQIPLPPGYTSNIAGGICLTDQAGGVATGFAVFGAVGQGSPQDNLMILEYLPTGPPPDVSVDMVAVGSTSFPYSTGGTLTFNVTFTNNDPVNPVSGVVWTYYSTRILLGPVPLSLAAGASQTFNNISQTVPGNRLPVGGPYQYYCGFGSSTSSPWATDYIAFFIVEGDGDGVPIATDWVTSSNFGGGSTNVGITAAPVEFALEGNYPNPFNPSTTISFALKDAGLVKLSVFDVSGREVANLVNGYRDAGQYQVNFDASDLASGVYLYRLTSGNLTTTAKMVLMK